MPRKCAVTGCTGTTNRKKYKFPKNVNQRKKWLNALNQDARCKVSIDTCVVCEKHFVETDFFSTDTNFYSGQPTQHKRLRSHAVPSVDLNVANPIDSSINNYSDDIDSSVNNYSDDDSTDVYYSDDVPNFLDQANNKEESNYTSDGIYNLVDQVINEVECSSTIENIIDFSQTTAVQSGENEITSQPKTDNVMSAMYSCSKVRQMKEGFIHYTGLQDYQHFKLVLQSLGPAAYELRYKYFAVKNITVEDQFLMTLMKLRTGDSDIELSFKFNVSQETVQNIVHTWIYFMALEFSELDIWHPKSCVKNDMPSGFKISYPSTRVIIDTTEYPIPSPSNTTLRKVKCKCKPQDSIVADEGFTVQDLIVPYYFAINIPPFLKGKSQLPAAVLENDSKLANKRVYIEKIKGLIKTYSILEKELPSSYVQLGSKIFLICCMLANFLNNSE